jgi:hypothetical protein
MGQLIGAFEDEIKLFGLLLFNVICRIWTVCSTASQFCCDLMMARILQSIFKINFVFTYKFVF